MQKYRMIFGILDRNCKLGPRSKIATGLPPGLHLAVFTISFLCHSVIAQSRSIARDALMGHCTDANILAELQDHYPEPISSSPNGKYILLRFIDSSQHISIAVADRSTRTIVKSMELNGEILHAEWSHNSQYVAFFLQPENGLDRTLYLWQVHENLLRKTHAVPSYAEGRVGWSVDDRYIAYADPEHGLVVYNVIADRSFDMHQPFKTFAWSSVADDLLLLKPGSETRVNRITFPYLEQSTYTLQTLQEANDIISSPIGKKFALLTDGLTHNIEICTEQGACRVLVTSSEKLSSLHWSRDASFLAYEKTSLYGRHIYTVTIRTGAGKKLTRLSGFDDIRENGLVSNRLVYMHRGANLSSLRENSISKIRLRILYQARSKRLPSIPPRHISASENWGFARAWVWRTAKHTKGVIIRIHGSNVTESPVWQDDIQLALANGMDYIALDFVSEPKVHWNLVSRQIMAIAQFAQERFKIAKSQIVLLGYSSGANIALQTSLQNPDAFGLVILVGPTVIPKFIPKAILKTSPFKLHIFRSREDVNRYPSAENDLKEILSKANLKTIKPIETILNDTHLMTKPTSWAAIYRILLSDVDLNC